MNQPVSHLHPCRLPRHGSPRQRQGSILLSIMLSAVVTLVGLTSCDTDAYESGDTSLSYLHADFVMAQTGQTKQVVGATNDDGERLLFDTPFECEWTTTADSTYRALLYYTFNPEDDEAPQPKSLVSVPVLQPKALATNERNATDPVGWESAWFSARQPYLNLALLLKTGVTEGLDNKQVIGIVDGGSTTQPDGTTIHRLSLYHDQNDVPQYYTTRIYVSIPTHDYHAGDSIVLTVNTYSGVVERTFVVSR